MIFWAGISGWENVRNKRLPGKVGNLLPEKETDRKTAKIKASPCYKILFFSTGNGVIFRAMVSILKKGASQKEQLAIKAKLRKKPVLDLRKFCGVIKLEEDPMEIQRQLREDGK